MPRDDEFVALLHEVHKININKHNYRGYTIVNTNNPTRGLAHFNEENRPIWFVCTGWGAQWMGRTKEFMKFPIFETRIKMCSKVLEKEGFNLYDTIMENTETVSDDFVKVFLTVGATQLALVDLLRSVGICPHALIGISTGELTCAYIDGVVTAEQVMQVAYHTALWSKNSNLPPAATAVVCGLTYEEVKTICPPGIYVAVHNDNKTCTVCGPEKQMPNFINSLLSQGIVIKVIKSIGVAFHTPDIAKEAEVLAHKIQQLIPNSKAASLHWVSSSMLAATGVVPLVERFSADYFMNIVTGTVFVQEALMHVPDNAIIVEISPHCALQLTLRKVLAPSVINVPLMSRDEPHQSEFLLSGLGKLYNAGIQINLSNLYQKVSFPVARGTQMINSMVQWDHSTEWMVPNLWCKAKKNGSRLNKCLLTIDVSNDKDMYLKGHMVNYQLVFPAAGYLYLVWKGFAQVNENWFENLSVRFENVEFHEDTVIPESGTLSFTVKFPQHGDSSSQFQLYENNRLLMSGYICKLQNECESLEIPVTVPEPQLLPLTAEDIYTDLRHRGFQYSGCFCSIKQSDNKGTSGTVKWQRNWVTFLDSLFQFAQIGSTSSELFLPRNMLTLTINLQEHENLIIETEEIQVTMHRDTNIMKAGGIQLQGLQFYVENKIDSDQNDPEVDRQIFIPYVNLGTVMLGQSVEESHANAMAVMVQIVKENVTSPKVKIMELADNLKEQELLSLHIIDAIKRLPEYKADVTVMSQIPEVLRQSTWLESLNIRIEDSSYAIHHTDYDLVVGTSDKRLPDAVDVICPGGFVLLEKKLNTEHVEIPGFTLVSMQQTFTSTYVLLRKDVQETQYSVVEVTNNNFKWVGKLQAALKFSKYDLEKIIILSQGEYQCGVLGLCKCLLKEPNMNKVRCVFVQDSTAPNFCETEMFYVSQLQKDLCINVFRNGAWGSLHYLNIGKQNDVTRLVELASVQVLNPGDLSTITWVESPSRMLKSENNESICSVHYASVNLEDVLDVSGATKNYKNPLLGQEFAGYNCLGQREMGLVPGGALATKVTTFSGLSWPVPGNWSLQQAVTVPAAYVLSLYALVVRGMIQKGEWVLIDSADSSVGHAAVTICLHKGCKVISVTQTEHQHLSGVHRVSYNSMENQVLALTAGQGVDVALSSLHACQHNQLLARCLGQHGRFLDITLPQLNTNRNLCISTFQNKIYHSIQMDTLFKPRSVEREQIVKLLSEGLESGVVIPLPAQVFLNTEINSAFQYVKDGDLSKKAIVKIIEETRNTLEMKKKLISAIPKVFMDPEKVYILIGGLGGFGMQLAQWLVQKGARKLVLTSRRGVTVGYKSLRIRRWQESGVRVITTTQDATNKEGAMSLLQESSKLGHVGGIFILSAVLRDSLFENQTEENFQEVCKAKIDVTRSLDALSRRLCPELEYFVAFSSIVSRSGNEGQTTYGMANSTLEMICEERRAMGLPALAIQWGVIRDVGMFFESRGNDATLIGTTPQNIDSCLRILEQVLMQPHAVVTSFVLPNNKDTDSETILEKDFMSTVANVLGMKDMSTINPNADAEDLGIDSLMSTEIKNTLEQQYSINLSSKQIYSLIATNLREQAA